MLLCVLCLRVQGCALLQQGVPGGAPQGAQGGVQEDRRAGGVATQAQCLKGYILIQIVIPSLVLVLQLNVMLLVESVSLHPVPRDA